MALLIDSNIILEKVHLDLLSGESLTKSVPHQAFQIIVSPGPIELIGTLLLIIKTVEDESVY